MEQLIEAGQQTIMSWGLSESLAALTFHLFVVFIVIVLCFLANLIAKRYLLKIVSYLIGKTKTQWDDILLGEKVFERLSHIAPALVIYLLAPVMFPAAYQLGSFVQRVALAYMIVIACLVIDALLSSGVSIYRLHAISKERPIIAYVQVVKIAIYIVTAIFMISMLADQSPWGLLSGLGAMTAVLMLVFKDSILGFVATIQLAANDMVRRGDWIEVPKYGADGDVIEVTLNTVKVQNWDKTISTIPTYALISDSIKNWRGMSESGGRRIKRSISIDMNTIHFCSDDELARFSKVGLISEYVLSKQKEVEDFNAQNDIDSSLLINGRRQTNLGVFRAYVKEYLRYHPKIHRKMTFLVRHLPPSERGLPIELYVFSNDQVWANYEGIQADIFDHILAALPEFGLGVFQNPSGRDFRDLAEGSSR